MGSEMCIRDSLDPLMILLSKRTCRCSYNDWSLVSEGCDVQSTSDERVITANNARNNHLLVYSLDDLPLSEAYVLFKFTV